MNTLVAVCFDDDWEGSGHWLAVLRAHGVSAWYGEGGNVVEWDIDLNARAPRGPIEAVSELRMSQGATLALIGFPDENEAGFRNFASIDSRSFTDDAFRSRLVKTTLRSLEFLYSLYHRLVQPGPLEPDAPEELPPAKSKLWN